LIFFNVIDAQYIFDATALIADEYNILVDWNTTLLRQLTFMVGAAQNKREKRAEAAKIAATQAGRR
jgi:hypothetical protein